MKLLGYNFDISQEYEEVRSLSEPDPDWEYTDEQGHTHTYKFDPPLSEVQGPGMTSWEVPTCYVEHETFFYPDGSKGSTPHYYCQKCDEEIDPQTRVQPFPYHIPTFREIEGTLRIQDEENINIDYGQKIELTDLEFTKEASGSLVENKKEWSEFAKELPGFAIVNAKRSGDEIRLDVQAIHSVDN